MKLIVGLGNPGKRYEATRHNLGFLVIDRLAAQTGIALVQELCEAITGEGYWDAEKVVLAKPQTFMNRSGSAVCCLLNEKQGGVADLVVIYDDLDLPFGRMRIRTSGSAGGHRGMSSILESTGAESFQRIRLGIGRPPPGVDAVDYVLGPFDDVERPELDQIVNRAAESVKCLVKDGADRAMACYNRLPG
jgi:PTH1 family peptidyl-tRNA hydrolase